MGNGGETRMNDTENGTERSPVDYHESAEPGRGRSTTEFDSVAESVVTAVSALTGTDPMELEPLYDVVDVDALDDLFAPKANGSPRSGGTISFTYCGCRVTVENSEQVTVESQMEASERRS